jgi:hypothetical protein
MKGLRRDNSGIAPLKRDGLLHSDPKTKAELLNNHLSSVFTSEDKICCKLYVYDVKAF